MMQHNGDWAYGPLMKALAFAVFSLIYTSTLNLRRAYAGAYTHGLRRSQYLRLRAGGSASLCNNTATR